MSRQHDRFPDNYENDERKCQKSTLMSLTILIHTCSGSRYSLWGIKKHPDIKVTIFLAP